MYGINKTTKWQVSKVKNEEWTVNSDEKQWISSLSLQQKLVKIKIMDEA